jgi:hypothetical protein
MPTHATSHNHMFHEPLTQSHVSQTNSTRACHNSAIRCSCDIHVNTGPRSTAGQRTWPCSVTSLKPLLKLCRGGGTQWYCSCKVPDVRWWTAVLCLSCILRGACRCGYAEGLQLSWTDPPGHGCRQIQAFHELLQRFQASCYKLRTLHAMCVSHSQRKMSDGAERLNAAFSASNNWS